MQDSGDRLGLQRAVLVVLVNVQAEAGTQAHGADYGVVCRAVLSCVSLYLTQPVASIIPEAYLVRHDAHAGRILVDEDMVRTVVRAIREYVFVWVVFVCRGGVAVAVVLVVMFIAIVAVIAVGLHRNGEEPADDGIDEPRRQRGIDKLITNKIRRPCLQATVCEVFPSRFRCSLYLEAGR